MQDSRSEQGVETDEGVTGRICVAGHHLHACKNVCLYTCVQVWLYACV